jgi:S-methylmethionine-dependent homocysteine/selenocysteine methylase
MNFSELLTAKKHLLLDGATGSELEARGISTELPLWSTIALLSDKGLITLKNIHTDYIRSGAEIITANTFRTNIRALKKMDLEPNAKALTLLAVDTVRRAIDTTAKRNIYIAGSVAPVEDCYHPEIVPSDHELQEEHRRHIDHLYDSGVDIILIETMNTIREALIALQYATQTDLPVCVSFICQDEEHLLSGETLMTAIKQSALFEPAVILVNCASIDIISGNLKTVRKQHRGFLGAYANIWHPFAQPPDLTYVLNPYEYAERVKTWIDQYHLKIIGGCCGTNPDHIRALSDLC